jgi:hypothetical protein
LCGPGEELLPPEDMERPLLIVDPAEFWKKDAPLVPCIEFSLPLPWLLMAIFSLGLLGEIPLLARDGTP